MNSSRSVPGFCDTARDEDFDCWLRRLPLGERKLCRLQANVDWDFASNLGLPILRPSTLVKDL